MFVLWAADTRKPENILVSTGGKNAPILSANSWSIVDRILKLEALGGRGSHFAFCSLNPLPVAYERLMSLGALLGELRSRARGSGRARAPSHLPTTPPFQPFPSSRGSLMNFFVRVCRLCCSDNFGNSGLLWERGNSFQAPVRPLPLEREVSIRKPAGFRQLLLCRQPGQGS